MTKRTQMNQDSAKETTGKKKRALENQDENIIQEKINRLPITMCLGLI